MSGLITKNTKEHEGHEGFWCSCDWWVIVGVGVVVDGRRDLRDNPVGLPGFGWAGPPYPVSPAAAWLGQWRGVGSFVGSGFLLVGCGGRGFCEIWGEHEVRAYAWVDPFLRDQGL
jgi:hypothetical protein